jgi:hypothetical protein
MNVLAYTFYAAVTKLLTGQEMWFILVVTAATNCIGFYLADWIFKKMQKDKLWRISCTVPRPAHAAAIKVKLDGYGITYNETKCAKAVVLDIFSLSQGESSLIKEVINKYNVKYHIIEIDKRL